MQQNISPHAAMLGAPVGEYRAPWRIYSLSGLTITSFFGYVLWNEATTSHIEWGEAAFLTGCTMFFLFFTIFGMFHMTRRIQLFEAGMMAVRPQRVDIWRWEDAISAQVRFAQSHGITSAEYIVRWRNGQKFKISGIVSQPADEPLTPGRFNKLTLIDTIGLMMDATLASRLDHMLMHYEAGQRIDFKKFQVSQHGIHVKHKELPWSLVSDIATDGTFMRVSRVGQTRPWRKLPLTALPNGDVLPTLIARTQGTHFSAFARPEDNESDTLPRHRPSRRARQVHAGLLLLLSIALPLGIALTIRYVQYRTSYAYHNERGHVLYHNGTYAAAAQAYSAAIAQAPERPMLYVNRGKAYRELGRFDDALADYDVALRLHPGLPDALVHRGRVFYRQGRYHQAIAEYNATLAQRPDYFFAYCNLGFSYKKLGENQVALADFQRCQDLATDDGWKTISREQIAALQ